MGLLRFTINWLIMRVAWLLGDVLGWRAPLAMLPPRLANKVAIVSGANAGLGRETAMALLQQGATVVMACRSLEHARAARSDILADPRNAGPLGEAEKRLIPLHLDLEDFGSIPRFVAAFRALRLPGLHVLVNNAGIHLKPHLRVSCGFERTMATDYFGHMWLTHLLLPELKASAPSRVVNVASIAELLGLVGYTYRLPIDDLRGRRLTDSGERPYTIAKTMLLCATREMARRLEGTGVDVLAVHPGIADSTWYLKSDNSAYLFSSIIARVRSVLPWLGVGQPVKSGAISLIYASVAPELTGSTSSPASHGLVDAANRVLFGGRLAYFGPSYLLLLAQQNWNNAGRCWAANPWCYNKGACKRLVDETLSLIREVEREVAQQQEQPGASSDKVAASVA